MSESPKFVVVVNHQDQYSIWQVGRQLPFGWSQVGTDGTREECLSYIEKTWVDMRPRSVRVVEERNSIDHAKLNSED
jgi:MbtH protein